LLTQNLNEAATASGATSGGKGAELGGLGRTELDKDKDKDKGTSARPLSYGASLPNVPRMEYYALSPPISLFRNLALSISFLSFLSFSHLSYQSSSSYLKTKSKICNLTHTHMSPTGGGAPAPSTYISPTKASLHTLDSLFTPASSSSILGSPSSQTNTWSLSSMRNFVGPIPDFFTTAEVRVEMDSSKTDRYPKTG
jgi:hypothetical protein